MAAAFAVFAAFDACTTSNEHATPPSPESSPPADRALALLDAAMATEAGDADAGDAEAPDAAPVPADASTDAASDSGVSARDGGAPRRAVGQELTTFHAALRGLEQHTRARHVRVEWLGDSHGAADFWSGGLRAALQKRFGDGGPGFAHLGFKSYRHDGLKVNLDARWLMRPRGPSTVMHTGDGTFGLGGILFGGGDATLKAGLTVTDPQLLNGTLRWDLCYKPSTPRDELTIALTGSPQTVAKGGTPGELTHVPLTSAGPPTLSLFPSAGHPELCGVVIETDPAKQPGVVLDALGINGARAATPLAWNEATWGRELARRAPSLVILEFGTNELGDPDDPVKYEATLAQVLERVRRVAPDADCAVLAPTDRADCEERCPLVRDALRRGARAQGCFFWDTYASMGGRGSIARWRAEKPPRAAPDGIHLTSTGYRELGDALAADLLHDYAP